MESLTLSCKAGKCGGRSDFQQESFITLLTSDVLCALLCRSKNNRMLTTSTTKIRDNARTEVALLRDDPNLVEDGAHNNTSLYL